MPLGAGCDDDGGDLRGEGDAALIDGATAEDAARTEDARVIRPDLAVPGADAARPDAGPPDAGGPCNDDEQCAPDRFCARDGICRVGCRVGGCPEGQACSNGVCRVPPCLADTDCPDGNWCAAGRCEAGCRTEPDDCGPGRRCDARRICIPVCAEEEICGNGLDDDCDGRADEGCEPPPPVRCVPRQPCEAEALGPCALGRTACPDGDEGASVCVAGEPAVERCDGVDNDCDGEVDEGFALGAACRIGQGACEAEGVVACAPGGVTRCQTAEGEGPQPELCNGLDDDCDGRVDEDFPGLGEGCLAGVGVCAGPGVLRCAEDGTALCDGQPGEPGEEVCDGADNDCDGEIDEGFPGVGEPCAAGAGGCRREGRQVCTPGGAALRCSVVAGAPTAEICDGIDNDCDGLVDEAPDGEALVRPCYTGLPDTEGVGECVAGEQTCDRGVWGRCEGQVVPFPEACDGLDRDCDGQVDEGPGGEPLVTACYDGPFGTAGVGECLAGARACLDGGVGPCLGQVLPRAEICDGLDNDCNGVVDDVPGEGGCACEAGAEQPCYGGPPGTEGVGVCLGGVQFCDEAGVGFGRCEGQTLPTPEQCNGVDDDCDGRVDESVAGVGRACTVGVGVCRSSGRLACDPVTGLRCDAAVVEPAPEACNGLDDDCDGRVDEGFATGGVCSVGVGDCRREGRAVCAPDGTLGCSEAPGAPGEEICDARDNDCDGLVDEGFGLGVACEDEVAACRVEGAVVCAPDGTAECSARVPPLSVEICDGRDNDCDGRVDEGLGVGEPCVSGIGACLRGGVRACAADGAVICDVGGPAGVEICNGLDDDCDGRIDEGNPGGGEPCDTGAQGRCGVGETTCLQATLRCVVTVNPEAERCSGEDEDCDGRVDEDFGGGEPCTAGVGACLREATLRCDAAGEVFCPAVALEPSPEVCNGRDDDCDGQVDEDAPGTGGRCAEGLGECAAVGRVACIGGRLACDAPVGEAQPELCNDLDDDCDGRVDEDFPVGRACRTGRGICQRDGVVACAADGTDFCETPPVEPREEVCNGLDDDCDGLVDEDGVCPDEEGPVIEIDVRPPVVNPGQQVVVAVRVSDESGVADTVVTLDDEPLELDGNGEARLLPEVPGARVVRVVAEDTVGNVSEALAVIRVRAPGDDEPPFVRITTPADGASLSGPVTVRGTFTDAWPALYRLEYSADGRTWFEISTGVESGEDIAVGRLDPTLLPPGLVSVRLTGEDVNGRSSWHIVSYEVPPGLSVGEMRLSIRDLQIPNPGFPLVVERTYDSRDRGVGDFGHGWRLTGLGARVVEDANSNVAVALPNGEFAVFGIAYEIPPILPIGSISYVPTDTSRGTLEHLDACAVAKTAQGVVCMFSGRTPAATISRYAYTGPDGVRLEIHDTEGLQRVTDRAGRSVELRPDRFLTSTGVEIALVRDELGRIEEVRDPIGGTFAYRYDAEGDLVEVVDPTGGVQRYHYDRAHRLLEIIGPDGNPVARTEYDAEGRKRRVIDALGNELVYAHDLDGRQEAVTDRRGARTVYTYDAGGRVTRRVDALGRTHTWTYDARGRLLRERPPGEGEQQSEYDADGEVVATVDGVGRRVTIGRAAFGEVTEMVNAAGERVAFEYDAGGKLLSVTNALGDVLTYTYDPSGSIESYTDPNGASFALEYDAAGRVSGIAGPDGFGRGFDVDAAGRMVGARDANGAEVRFEYDGAGRLMRMIEPDGGGLTVERDPLGRATAVTDATGHTTRLRYDARGVLDRVTDPGGARWAYEYDAEGDLVATVDPEGGRTELRYDATGRVSARVDALGNQTAYTFDAAGRLTRRVDGAGRRVDWTYDASGLPATRSLTGGPNVTWQHDATGRLVAAVMPEGTARFAHDAAGRITAVTHPDGTVVGQTYDAAGERVAREGLGGEVTYVRDGMGRLIGVTDPVGGTVTMERDPEGRLLRQRLPGGVVTQYDYDVVGRPMGHTITRQGAVLHREVIERDLVGRVVAIERADGSREALRYSAAGDLVEVVARGADGVSVATRYEYDTRGNRVRVERDGAAPEVLTYDAANRLTADGRWEYEYDGAGRLATRTRHADAVVERFAYDALGQLVGWTQEDADGERISEVAWIWDAFGRVTSRTQGARTERYTYDGDERAWTRVGDVVVERAVHGDGPDELLLVDGPGGVRGVVRDHRGDVVLAVSAAGQVVGEWRYDAFGARTRVAGATELPYGFGARPHDAATGLIDLRARSYDPRTGRFIQPDPHPGDRFSPRTLNPYIYGRNDPHRYRDPSGAVAVLSYAFLSGRFFGLGASANAPNSHEMIGSLIGFFRGFGTTALVFLANILDLSMSTGDAIAHWNVALSRTKAQMDEVSRVVGAVAGLDDTGFTGGFVNGAGYKVGIKLTVGWKPPKLVEAGRKLADLPPTKWEQDVSISKSVGGFKSGVANYLDYLAQIGPR